MTEDTLTLRVARQRDGSYEVTAAPPQTDDFPLVYDATPADALAGWFGCIEDIFGEDGPDVGDAMRRVLGELATNGGTIRVVLMDGEERES